jgi:Baseplate J-like protein
MDKTLEEEVNRVVASMDENTDQEQSEPIEETPEPEETYHVYRVPGGMVILKEGEPESQVVDSDIVPPKQGEKRVDSLTLLIVLICCIPMLGSIAFQIFEILNPPIATVTIFPKSQTVTLTGTLQLGRLLNPLTLSQSQATPTTGKGHQDARSAIGHITFYNGQFQSISVAAGTIFTASNGVQVITEQDALIPAASPPIEGQITVSAHAANTGRQGNISAKKISEACCAISVLAVNLTPFTGGQDERNFQTVRTSDIASVATPLKTAVAKSMRGALQGQVKANEQLQMLPCTPTISSDHQPGEEAREVKITVSQTCSAVAYNSQELERKAADLLNHQAATQAGSSYSLFGAVRVTSIRATTTYTSYPLVFLSFQASGTWIYALSFSAQQQIKTRIAGKTKTEALRLLASLPGVESASISWGDESRLPKDANYIHITLVVV